MPVKTRGATYMTVSELAEQLDTHRNNVIYWIKSGDIKAVRRGLARKSPYLIPIKEAHRVIRDLNGATPV